jgi:hypothetical protein
MGIFDDLDWKEMAIAGGLAEEMADEEREWREFEREMRRDAEEIDAIFEKDSMPRRHRPSTRRRRPGRHDLFMAWAQDVIHGRKRSGDPLLGPPRPEDPSRGLEPRHKRTVIAGVPVENAHLVSENFLRVMHLVFISYPEHGIQKVGFDPFGKTVVDGEEVFGTFERSSRLLVLNLHRHLENALRVTAHGNSHASVLHLYWTALVRTFLHELKHALDVNGAALPSGETRAEQEAMADVFAAEIGTALHRRGDLEPPAAAEDPYLGPRVFKILGEDLAAGVWAWAERQLAMLREGVLFGCENPKIEIRTEKQYYDLSLEGQKSGQGPGRMLNQLVAAGLAAEEAAWDMEENRRKQVEEAILFGVSFQAVHTLAPGKAVPLTLSPRAVVKRDFFLWVHAFCKETQELSFFRIDRITLSGSPSETHS